MNKQEQIEAYLTDIILPLTNRPEEVKINLTMEASGFGIVANVLASDEDMPLLIGKAGAVASAIRKLIEIWCEVNSAKVIMIIGNPLPND